jgi:5-formyltetrahydrofolate cyclo-ligase
VSEINESTPGKVPDASSQKRALRIEAQNLRGQSIAPEELVRANAEIESRVLAHEAFRAARCVHCYLGMGSEVETRGIIQHALDAGKRVCIPLWQKGSAETRALRITSLRDENYAPGGFGLRVPRVQIDQPLGEIDLVLAPLLRFAPVAGGYARLGYGAGYYDRLIATVRRLNPVVRVIGLAFHLQRADALPLEPQDALLDEVITNAR